MFILFQVATFALEASKVFFRAMYPAFLSFRGDDVSVFHPVLLVAVQTFGIAIPSLLVSCRLSCQQTGTQEDDQNHAPRHGYLQRARQE